MSLTNSPIWFGSGATGGGFYNYEINDSLRFNDDDSAYLNRTPSSAGNRKTWTWSGWFKRGNLSAAEMDLFSAGNSSTDRFEIILSTAYPNQLQIYMDTSGTIGSIITSQVFRDVSAWYHLVIAFDTTQATASNRVKIYVNGSQITAFNTATYPSLNFNTAVNSTSGQFFSKRNYVDDRYYDGYMADVYMIDGQALDPTSFGETKDGVWIPKAYGGTYGTNGFYLDFSDNSTATNLGLDSSGNSNNWSVNGIATTDQMTDSPTNNFSTMSQLLTDTSNTTFSEGNLKTVNSNASTSGSSIAVNSGKWFVEMICTAKTATNAMIGICTVDGFDGQKQLDESDNGGSGHGYVMNATKLPGGASYGATWAIDDIIGIALDLDSGQNTVTFYKNGSTQGAIDIDNALYVFCNSNGQGSSTVTYVSNFGQDGTFAGEITAGGNSDGNGVGDFKYSVPSGYLALCTANLSDPTIGPTADTLATDNFNTVLHTGDGAASKSITSVNFKPDLNWVKQRNIAQSHTLTDIVRGPGFILSSNAPSADYSLTTYGQVTSFDTDGFTVSKGSDATYSYYNQSGGSYAAWNWKAGGTAVSNSDGSITSDVSANVDAGFSIVSYTGNVTAGATIGHGLSATPEFIIVKNISNTDGWSWVAYNKISGNTKYLYLNTGAGDATYNMWNNTSPTSSVFSVSSYTGVNGSSDDMLAYCFHSVDGYSKVGVYTGNSSADGTFVYTGFRPAYILIKGIDAAFNWTVYDNKRDPINVASHVLYAGLLAQENTGTARWDFLSNGFKARDGGGNDNTSGQRYIYLAFAENPFKYANAR